MLSNWQHKLSKSSSISIPACASKPAECLEDGLPLERERAFFLSCHLKARAAHDIPGLRAEIRGTAPSLLTSKVSVITLPDQQTLCSMLCARGRRSCRPVKTHKVKISWPEAACGAASLVARDYNTGRSGRRKSLTRCLPERQRSACRRALACRSSNLLLLKRSNSAIRCQYQ